MTRLSPRLAEIVAALPLRPGMRIVEIGCGPGAAARAVAELVGPRGHVLAVDRSERAISRVESTAADLIAEGRMSTRLARAEELHLHPGEDPYPLAFAVRGSGVFDGRHPRGGLWPWPGCTTSSSGTAGSSSMVVIPCGKCVSRAG